MTIEGFDLDSQEQNTNEFGEQATAAVAEVREMIANLPENTRERVLEVFDDVTDDSMAMFAGWKENMDTLRFPIEKLREQFNLLAEEFARDRNITSEDNPKIEQHMKTLTQQSALGIRMVAQQLGANTQLLDKVVPREDFE